jgi:hypothetical protein
MNRNSRSRTKRNAALATKIVTDNPGKGNRQKPPAIPRKPRNKHERLQRQLEARRRVVTIFSPAFGAISHAADGRAYTREIDGSIRRVSSQDRAPKWKQRARTIRDFLTTIKLKAA